MKKEVSKNKKLGLIIAIAAVVLLAVVGVVLALVLGGGNQGKEEKFESKLYWNIDGKSMLSEETAMSTRKAAEDGLYYIRYLVGGEIVEIPFADKKLVTQADRAEVSCLKFDADGIAIEVVDPEELYVRIQDKTYVQAIDGNKITTNTSTVLNGMKKQLELPADVPVVNVATRTGKVEVGATVELEIFDQVLIYGSDEDTITDIFVTDRYWESEIYWRIGDRVYWDATRKVSTRPLADDGYWYIDLACNGEVKTYKVAAQDCINALDSKGPTDAATGLVFDENGAIVNMFNAGLACRGTLQANSYDVTNISEDGKTFTATRIMFGTEIGKTYTGTITEDTQIYNITSTAEDHRGEPTTLQLNDRLQVFQAADGSIHTIFVVNRMVDSPFYYNLSRKWSSVTGLTRETDENGYYVYELAVKGKVKTVRTKDKAIAEQMDGANLSVFGLRLKGDIVTKVYDAVNVAGNWSFSTSNFVQTTEGGILGTVSTTGTAANGVMAANCEVYDVSNCYKNFRGEKATVREGDQILAYQNAVGEVTHIWILNRYVKGTTIYWNMNRYYANGETTRTPDADGYYVFNCIKAGTTKVVQLKTKDKEVASRFDKEGSTTAAALKVKGDIIQAAYPAPAAIGGYYRLSGFWVHELCYNDDPNSYALIARTGAIGGITLADDCKVLNFSAITKKATGETTQLKLGDYVWPIAGSDGKIHYIFIVEREVEGSKIAWRKTSLATLKDAEGNVLKDKDGNNMLQADEDGYYVFTLWVNGKIGTYKTKDLKLANYVNTRATGFSVSVKGNIITGAYPISSEPNTRASSVSYYDYVKTVDGVMHLKRNRVGQTDTGNEMTVTLADSYKAYNFDPASGDNWGKQVKLTKGDRVYAYSNNAGESYIFFIMYDCTLEGGNEQYCEHCGKKVHWESIFAGYSPAAGCIPEVAHYYVPTDYATTGFTLGNQTQLNEGVATEIVLNLNGKTLTRKGTLNTASGIVNAPSALLTASHGNTLRIVDYSKAKSGKVTSEAGTLYNGAGSLLHVQQGSTLIVDGGVFDARKGTVNYTAANGGTVSVGGTLIVNGGTIYGRASNGNGSAIGAWGGSSITINGGTLIGNTVKGEINGTGHGGVIATNGNLTITGGTIKGGTAAAGGDNIYVGNPNAQVVISGGNIDGGIQIDAAKSVKLSGKPQIAAGKNYGLKLASTVKIDATGLKAGAKVYVDASGVFTTDFASAKAAQAVIDNGMLKSGAEGMMLKVDGKAIASVPDGKLREWTDSTKLPDMGRWKLATDVTITSRKEVTAELYIDLNGHDITRTVAADATVGCQVFRVNGGKLTIDDSTGNNGVVSTAYADGQAINDYSAVIHITDKAEFVLEGGIIDGSNVDNLYTNANSGTISVGGKLTVNGGVIKGIKRGSANGGAIGAWAGTEITVNGGEIYTGGTFLNTTGIPQKVCGAAIATTGKLTVNGGKIIGPGATSDPEKRARSGGLIYANGDSLTILGGELIDGFGTGYGFNVYYERNYNLTVEGERKNFSGGGEVVIGGDAFIKGGVTIRSGKADDHVKLTVKDTAVIDSAGAVSATNIRLVNGELFLNADTTPITTSPEAGANYDISIVYTCKNVPKGFSVGNTTKYEHTYGDDHICDDCGYDKNTPQEWTDSTKLPTSGNWILKTAVNPTATTALTGDLYIDLNGYTVTGTKAPVITAGGYSLTVDDLSGKTGDQLGKITTTTIAAGNYAAGVIYGNASSEITIENGIIDGSNVTTTYTSANAGTITVSKTLTVNGGKIIGWTTGGNGGAIGSWGGTTIVINDGEIVGGTVTKSINGTGYGGAIAANGNLTIAGGKIHGGSASVHGDNIWINNANAVFTMTGGEADGGVCLNNFNSASISGTVKIGEGAKYGLKLANSKKVNMTGLTGGEIYVDCNGVFTTDFADSAAATAAMGFLRSGETGKSLKLEGNAIAMVADLTLTLSKTSVTLTVGDEETITATAEPNTATVTWTSNNEAVATVVDGKITAVAAGNATITATAELGGVTVSKTCAVTVNVPASQLPMEEQDWVDWTDGTKLPTAGKYKLTTNVTTASTTLTGELWLDLNGYTVSCSTANVIITAGYDLLIDDLSGKTGDELGCIKTTATSGSARAAVIYANVGTTASTFTLNNGIIDGTAFTNTQTNLVSGAVTVGNGTDLYGAFIMNGGVIKGQKCSVMTSGVGGSAIGLMNATSFTMNGGTIYAHSAGSTAANVCCTGSCINAGTATITINGGEMYAGRAQNHGAAIYTSGNLYMNGGKIVGCQSQNSGAIYSGGTSLTVTGGVILGGKTVANPGNGGAIDYAKNGGVLTIGGNAVIGGGVNIRSSAKLVLKDAPIIDTSMGLQNRFDVRINGGSVYLNDTTGTAIQSTNGYYSLTYGADGKVNGLKEFAAKTVTESATLPTTGAVKLTSDVTLDAALTLTGDLSIDLNGHTVTRNVAASATGAQYAINTNGKNLTITDSAETKGSVKTLVEGDAAVAIEVGVVKVAGGKFLLDAVLDGNDAKTSYITDCAAAVTVDANGQFVLLGGEVKGITNTNAEGSSKPGGSAIAVPSTGAASKIVIYGGKVTAFQSTTSVSNCAPVIYNKAANTTIYIYDGLLTGSRATNHSGGIMTAGNMYIYGGTLTGGTAYHSGLIQSTGAVLEITGGTLVGGKATANANGLGGASIDYAKSGGVLTIGGTAKIAGGVSLRSSAKLVLTGKAVIDMNMEGQTQKLFNIRFKNGTCSIYLHDTTGTALASGGTGSYDVTYDAAGNITGITAK